MSFQWSKQKKSVLLRLEVISLTAVFAQGGYEGGGGFAWKWFITAEIPFKWGGGCLGYGLCVVLQVQHFVTVFWGLKVLLQVPAPTIKNSHLPSTTICQQQRPFTVHYDPVKVYHLLLFLFHLVLLRMSQILQLRPNGWTLTQVHRTKERIQCPRLYLFYYVNDIPEKLLLAKCFDCFWLLQFLAVVAVVVISLFVVDKFGG